MIHRTVHRREHHHIVWKIVFAREYIKALVLEFVHVTKLLQSRSPWSVVMQNEDGSHVSIHGDIPSPIQVLDSSSSECLLQAWRERSTKSSSVEFQHEIRACSQDGASSNKKYEREGGKADFAGRSFVSWKCCCFCVTAERIMLCAYARSISPN